jgi:hypothetical protein
LNRCHQGSDVRLRVLLSKLAQYGNSLLKVRNVCGIKVQKTQIGSNVPSKAKLWPSLKQNTLGLSWAITIVSDVMPNKYNAFWAKQALLQRQG